MNRKCDCSVVINGVAAVVTVLCMTIHADVWTVRTPARAAGDPDWNAYYDSDHFAVWYSGQYSCTQAQAKTGLDELEKVFDFYVNQKEFATAILKRTPNYKVNCCIIGSGLYGGLDAQGNPGMWIGVAGLADKWGLAHEFTHALQGVTGGFNGGRENYTGWFWECHANWMPHQLYPDNPHCSEMYLRMSNLYYGSHRCRYCNWQLLEYLKEKNGISFINKLWETSGVDVLETIMKNGGWDAYSFGDLFADFAAKNVVWDYQNGAIYRSTYGGQPARNKWRWYTYLQALDTMNNRYVVPFAAAPQRYGYNIVRLYPSDGATEVTVRFRGCVQTGNANSSYKSTNQWEPAAIPEPGSDWRYSLVAVTAPGSARYSGIKRFSDGAPDVSLGVTGASEVYLVVTAAPTVYARIVWDQMYYTIYRYPWMVEIQGARPQGFEPVTVSGKTHSNGGGFVANSATVASTAYVGPFARVLGGKVEGTARIEDRAIVKGGTVSGSAVVKDNAMVAGGTVSGSAVVADNAAVWGGTVTGNGRAEGLANVNQITVRDNACIGGACWVLANVTVSGTALLLGDGEIVADKSRGAHYGLIDNSDEGNVGNGRTGAVAEVTRQGPFAWNETVAVADNASSARFRQPVVRLHRAAGGKMWIMVDAARQLPVNVVITDLKGRTLWRGRTGGRDTPLPVLPAPGNFVIWHLDNKGSIAGGTCTIAQ